MDNNYLERNYRILEAKMIEEMDLALDFGKKLVDSELDAGLLDFLVKPIIKSFYNYWSVHDARSGTLEQIKIALDCGKTLIMNNIPKDKYDKLIEETFPKYFINDQIYRQCKKNHKNFEELKNINIEMFILQIQETITLLKITDDVEDYDALVRAAFATKEEAYQSLIRQLDLNDECIKLVEKDSTILKIPTGKNIILKVLRKGFIQTKKYLLDGLDEIYD